MYQPDQKPRSPRLPIAYTLPGGYLVFIAPDKGLQKGDGGQARSSGVFYASGLQIGPGIKRGIKGDNGERFVISPDL